jgi:hypothetical protein
MDLLTLVWFIIGAVGAYYATRFLHLTGNPTA